MEGRGLTSSYRCPVCNASRYGEKLNPDETVSACQRNVNRWRRLRRALNGLGVLVVALIVAGAFLAHGAWTVALPVALLAWVVAAFVISEDMDAQQAALDRATRERTEHWMKQAAEAAS